MRNRSKRRARVIFQLMCRVAVKCLAPVAFAAWAGNNAPAYAGPAGESVVRGNVSFERVGNRTIIRASDGSIINYGSFSIGANELVRFIQPGEFARVLNRVNGPDPSVIAGRLRANGQVYIVNPAGVYFTNGAVVDVAGLHAAAGHISDARFINGLDRFSDLTGSVINDGSIRGSNINLIGHEVANHGSIRAPRGVITMLAGDDVVIRRHGDRINLKIDGVKLTGQAQPQHGSTPADMEADPAVENSGVISANRGKVALAAGDMYALAVRNSGQVQARKGNINLLAADGLIHNTTTGNIKADKGAVTLQAPSVLHAGMMSADADRGRAGSVEVTSQNHTYLTQGSLISAAGGRGKAHGGEILVHSYDGQTVQASGAVVDVSGGRRGGDGGFVEVSGEHLTFNGYADLNAKRGFRAGHLLLDPHNIDVTASGGNDAFLNSTGISFGTPNTAANISISAAALGALTGTITLQATGNIWIHVPVTFNANGTTNLALEAQKSIVINAPLFNLNNFTAIADHNSNGFGDLVINVPLSFAGNAIFRGVTTFLNGSTLTSGGSQDYLGAVDLCQDMTLTGTRVQFHDLVNATNPGLQGLVVRGPNGSDGVAIFDGRVGWLRELKSLCVHSEAQLNGGLLITTGFQKFLGPVQLDQDASHHISTNAGLIRFANTVDGAEKLLVETAGLTRFDDRVGGQTKLEAVWTDPEGATRIKADMDAGLFDFRDPVSFAGNSTITGDHFVRFAQTIEAEGHSLIVNSPLTYFLGDGVDFNLLHTDAAGVTIVGANLTGNTIDFGDQVQIITDSTITGTELVNFDQTVDGPHNLIVNSDVQARFGGDVGGQDTLASLTANVGPAFVVNQNLIVFDGKLIRTTGDILLNPGGRSEPAFVATIAARDGGGVMLNSMNGSVLMGPNEKLTALGPLKILALNGAATLGDLNSFGSITVTSPDIRIWGRSGGSILNSTGGTINDGGGDFVAYGNIHFSSAPALIGPGAQPIFITRSGQGFSATLNGFEKRSFAGLYLDKFLLGDLVLDLTVPAFVPPPPPPPPPTRDPAPLATVYGETSELNDRVPVDPFAIRALERLGIYMRELRQDEMRSAARGRQLLNSMPEGARPATSPQELAIATSRLRRDSVLNVVDRYSQIFLSGSQPDAEAAAEDQSAHIRAALGRAWKDYGRDDVSGFAQFVSETPLHAEAMVYLEGLRGMFREIWVMGVTRRELRQSLDGVLGPITPAGMTQTQLEQAIGVHTLG